MPPSIPIESNAGRPDALLESLQAVRRKVRTLSLLFGVGLVVAGTVGAVLLVVLLDYLLNLHSVPRLIFILAAVGGIAYVAYQYVMRPMAARLSLNDVAGRLEGAFPQFDDRLRSTVDFVNMQVPGSELMKGRVIGEASRMASSVRLDSALVVKPVLWSMAGGLFAVLLAVSLILMNSHYAKIAMSRLLMVNAQSWPKRVEINVTKGLPTKVPVGQRIDYRMKLAKGDRAGLKAVVFTQYDNGPVQQQLMTRGEDGTYSVALDARGSGMKVWVKAGDDETAPAVVNVVQRLALSGVTARVTPPAYAKAQANAVNLAETPASMVVGSNLELHLNFNKPLAPDKPVVIEPVKAEMKLPHVTWLNAGSSAVGTWTAAESLRFRVRAIDQDYFENTGLEEFQVIVRPDQNPSVIIEKPQRTEDRTPTALVMLEALAEDDFDIATMTLVVDRVSGQEKKHWEVPLSSWAQVDTGSGDRRRFRVKHEWELGQLEGANLKPGDVLEYFVRVTDNFALDGAAHEPAISGKLKINIISQETLAMQVTEAMRNIAEKVRQVRNTQERTRQETANLKNDLMRKGRFDAADRTAISRLNDQQNTVASQTRQIAGQMADQERRMAENRAENRELQNVANDVRNNLTETAEKQMSDAARRLSEASQQAGDARANQNQRDQQGQQGQAQQNQRPQQGENAQPQNNQNAGQQSQQQQGQQANQQANQQGNQQQGNQQQGEQRQGEQRQGAQQNQAVRQQQGQQQQGQQNQGEQSRNAQGQESQSRQDQQGQQSQGQQPQGQQPQGQQSQGQQSQGQQSQGEQSQGQQSQGQQSQGQQSKGQQGQQGQQGQPGQQQQGQQQQGQQQQGQQQQQPRDEQQAVQQGAVALDTSARNQQQATENLNKAIDRMGNLGTLEEMLDRVRGALKQQQELSDKLREIGKETIGKQAKDLTQQQREKLDQVAADQKKAAEQNEKLMQELNKAAQQTSKSDPASSQAMQQAAQQGQQQQVSSRQNQAAQAAQQNQQAQAQANQKQAELGLQVMLDTLREAERRKLEQLAKELLKLQDLIVNLVRRQSGHNIDNLRIQDKEETLKLITDELLAKADRAKDAQPAKPDAGQLTNFQAQTERNARDVAKSAEDVPESGAEIAASLTKAAGLMERAVVDLKETKLPAAYDPSQVEALSILESALAKANDAAKKVEEQMKQAQKDSIRQVLEKIRAEQAVVNAETTRIEKTRSPQGQLNRVESINLGKLPGKQGELADKTKELEKPLQDAGGIVYVWASKDVVDGMNEVKKDLAKPTTAKPTQIEQQRVIDQLDAMIRNLAVKPNDPEFERPPGAEQQQAGGGQGQPPKPRLPSEIELRLMKELQIAVNKATKDQDAQPNPDKAKLVALGNRQGEFRDLLDQLIQKASRGEVKLDPEPDPKDRLPEEAGAADVENQEFDEWLKGGKPGDDQMEDDLKMVGQRMARSRQRLALDSDPGKTTQLIQERILTNLDHLVQMARNQQSQAQSQPGQGQGQGQQARRQQQGQQNQPQNQGQQDLGLAQQNRGQQPAGDERLPGAGANNSGSNDIREKAAEWANQLPPRVRDAVIEGAGETVIEKYKKITDGYYEMMSKKATQER